MIFMPASFLGLVGLMSLGEISRYLFSAYHNKIIFIIDLLANLLLLPIAAMVTLITKHFYHKKDFYLRQ